MHTSAQREAERQAKIISNFPRFSLPFSPARCQNLEGSAEYRKQKATKLRVLLAEEIDLLFISLRNFAREREKRRGKSGKRI